MLDRGGFCIGGAYMISLSEHDVLKVVPMPGGSALFKGGML